MSGPTGPPVPRKPRARRPLRVTLLSVPSGFPRRVPPDGCRTDGVPRAPQAALSEESPGEETRALVRKVVSVGREAE